MAFIHKRAGMLDTELTCQRYRRRYGYAPHGGPYIGAAYHADTNTYAIVHTDTRIIHKPDLAANKLGWRIYAD